MNPNQPGQKQPRAPQASKRAYRKPRIESARAFVRNAVACPKADEISCPGFDPAFIS